MDFTNCDLFAETLQNAFGAPKRKGKKRAAPKRRAKAKSSNRLKPAPAYPANSGVYGHLSGGTAVPVRGHWRSTPRG